MFPRIFGKGQWDDHVTLTPQHSIPFHRKTALPRDVNRPDLDEKEMDKSSFCILNCILDVYQITPLMIRYCLCLSRAKTLLCPTHVLGRPDVFFRFSRVCFIANCTCGDQRLLLNFTWKEVIYFTVDAFI